ADRKRQASKRGERDHSRKRSDVRGHGDDSCVSNMTFEMVAANRLIFAKQRLGAVYAVRSAPEREIHRPCHLPEGLKRRSLKVNSLFLGSTVAVKLEVSGSS